LDLTPLLADLALVFAAGVVTVLALARLGLPSIVGFLVAGLVIGPHALGLIDDVHAIELLAELGVALLLFAIGLEMSLARLRRIGWFVVLGGSLQVGLTIAGSTAVALLLGLEPCHGVFWGYLAAVSSTAIVLRLLSDRDELDALHGRFVVGVLIFQDLAIVPMMLTIPLLAGDVASPVAMGAVLGKAALVVLGVLLVARGIVPRLLGHAATARSREVFVLTVLLVLSTVTWATSSLGLSLALGAFLAGVIVAETEFVHQVLNDVGPFRDAFASLFFVSVGMLLDPSVLWAWPLHVGGLVLLLMLGKLASAALCVMVLRLPARVAILAGVALAQVGEFSFVLLDAGEDAGLVATRGASMFLAASVVTMAATPLLVAFSPRLAAHAGVLRPLERLLGGSARTQPDQPRPGLVDHVIVAGLGVGGRALIRGLEAASVPYVGLELDARTVLEQRGRGRNVRYGDATSLTVLEHVAHVEQARQVALLLSDVEAAKRTARAIRRRFPHVHVLLRVHRLELDGGELDVEGIEVVGEDHETAFGVVQRVLLTVEHRRPPT
jgi:CPA2 family monovalent cation:H+ antiporter-2